MEAKLADYRAKKAKDSASKYGQNTTSGFNLFNRKSVSWIEICLLLNLIISDLPLSSPSKYRYVCLDTE